jgi:hypothetical protein
MQVMAIPSLLDDFAATVKLYSTFMEHMKAENPQMYVSEVSFAHEKAGKNSFGKCNSSGMSNVSNDAVDDRFFEYHALTPDQKNTLRRKRLEHVHVGKGHSGNGNDSGKNSGKGPMIKSLTRSIAGLTTKIDKFSLPA